MIQTNVVEDKEATMVGFFNELNRDIANVVELQYNMELENMVHMVTKMKRQIKRKGSVSPQISLTSSSSIQRLNLKREGVANITSTTFIRKLNLNIVKHPKSYRLQCLNECGEVKITKQVTIFFAIGRYL